MTQVTNNCPVCKDQGNLLSYVIRGYAYKKCKSCGMLYIRDGETDAKPHHERYDSDYFKDTLKKNLTGYMNYEKQSRPLRMNFRALLSRIHPYLLPGSPLSMLDVGCAYGFLLDEARKIGMSVHGLDLSESAVQWMEKHLAIKGTVGLSSEAPQGPYDLITAVEVLEHIQDLPSFLDDLYERLREGGILAIATGANDAPVARLLGRRWWYLNPPDHCSIFSRPALKKLISDKGFNVLDHGLVPFHWVGLNNIVLKLSRILESQRLGQLAAALPALVVPVFHCSSQLLIARKP